LVATIIDILLAFVLVFSGGIKLYITSNTFANYGGEGCTLTA
jgi:hypothetical protein